jgi:hypothetical protein
VATGIQPPFIQCRAAFILNRIASPPLCWAITSLLTLIIQYPRLPSPQPASFIVTTTPPPIRNHSSSDNFTSPKRNIFLRLFLLSNIWKLIACLNHPPRPLTPVVAALPSSVGTLLIYHCSAAFSHLHTSYRVYSTSHDTKAPTFDS